MRALVVLVFCISAILGLNIYNIYLRYEMMRVSQEQVDKIHDENMLILKAINEQIDMLEQLQELKQK